MLVRFAAVCSAAAALLASAAVAIAAGNSHAAARAEPPLVTDAAALQKSVCSAAANASERGFCAGFVARLAVANRDTNDLVALAATMIKDDLALRSVAPAKLSYSLQYLMLQQQMQNEGRAFTALSNIMKTKHDTVKNSISNVR